MTEEQKPIRKPEIFIKRHIEITTIYDISEKELHEILIPYLKRHFSVFRRKGLDIEIEIRENEKEQFIVRCHGYKLET